MKKILLITALWIIGMTSCTRVKKNYYENGALESEIQMSGDKYEGDAIWYYPNGKIKLKAFYKDDKLEGEYVRYYKNGKVLTRKMYKDGLANGEYTKYSLTGVRLFIKHYKNDTLHGYVKEFHEDTHRLKSEGNYVMGLKDGDWIYYDKLGKVEGRGKFSNGSGVETLYYPEGQVKQITHYKNGKKDGEEIQYFPNGNVFSKQVFKDGKPVKNEK